MSDKPINPDLIALHSVIDHGLTDVILDANPLAVHLNTRIQSASKGKVSMSFDLTDQYIQGNGVVQGGALAMLLDFGLAFAGLSQVSLQQNLSTTNMNTSYMRPGLPGAYRVEAEVEKAGRNMIFARAQLYDANDKLVASANSPLMVLN